jgi:hypothetical protein
MACLPSLLMAQAVVAPHMTKPIATAPIATAPIAKPAVTKFVAQPVSVARPQPPKPQTATAVPSARPVTGSHEGIIFVGGKPQGGSKVELNPQPIPPGHSD